MLTLKAKEQLLLFSKDVKSTSCSQYLSPKLFGESFSKEFLKNFKLEDYVKKNQ